MKVLVFSDSHGNTTNMAEVIRRERPDRVLHLGDLARDARALMAMFPGLPLDFVPGNCDGSTGLPEVKILELCGRKIMMTHGHIYHVKSGYEDAIWAAREEGADILLFGHTHEAYCAYQSGLWVMNPGSCRGPAAHGVIALDKGNLMCYTL